MGGSLTSAIAWSTAGTAVRLACGFLSIKVTAVFLGPAGLVLVGQLSNFMTLLQATVVNGADTAMIKMTAESDVSDPQRAGPIIGTALRMVVAIGVAVALVLLLLHRQVASWLLGDAQYWPAVLVLAFVLPVGLVAPLFTSLFTARRRFNLVALTGIIGTVAGAAIFIPAAWHFGVWGGLIGVVVVYPMVFAIGFAISRQNAATNLLSHWPQARLSLVRSIARFYPMLLAHSAALPLALILVRGMLMDEFGEAQAGLWQATARLSDIYTMVFLTTLSMYSLPTLAGARSELEYCLALRRMIVICAAAMSATIAALYLGRDLIVELVFTEEFGPVRDLWAWRLAGDLFFVAGWPMRSALVARGRQLAYIVVELAVGVGLFLATSLLMKDQGIAAANIAHALIWATVFVALVILHWRPLFSLRDGGWMASGRRPPE